MRHGIWLRKNCSSWFKSFWNIIFDIILLGLPRGASGKESACQCRRHKRHRFDPWVGKIPWKMKWQPAPLFLPGKFHGQRATALGATKSWTWLSDWTHTHNSTAIVACPSAGLVKKFQLVSTYKPYEQWKSRTLGRSPTWVFWTLTCVLKEYFTVIIFLLVC